jgi:acetate kinase
LVAPNISLIMNVLVMNPGGNSLKAEVVACAAGEPAHMGRKLASVILEGIGKNPCLSVEDGKKVVHTEAVPARDWKEAAASIFHWLEREKDFSRRNVNCIGVRVVHGGRRFTQATEINADVEQAIRDHERLAPLHNKSSLELLPPIRSTFPAVPLFAVFDTAFHATIPEIASHYAIPLDVAEQFGIRRFGFHGTSHRYIMGRAASLLNKPVEQLRLVTMHLESGCSATAIANGKSFDNTMGFTPLEGLMMGSRSGDVDPSLIAFLMREQRVEADDVMAMLNRQSGLLGVSGKSLDTRVLMREYGVDSRVTLAIDMFAYRLVRAVGAYLAVLNGADAIVFGGGIGENNVVVRRRVCESLAWCGLRIDTRANESLIDSEGVVSSGDSAIRALVVVAEEGLQIALECCDAVNGKA